MKEKDSHNHLNTHLLVSYPDPAGHRRGKGLVTIELFFPFPLLRVGSGQETPHTC